ncbi:heavy-metal-associated domain-containing protein [Pseudonocardia spinosispora]|uniref:heavy-metal-associated domain-containing protein n=1 Tax=Pseudonocardia spinosispora TaxID=103441 RepID=UPI0003F78A77|nr:heavy-metal-associated domain-containing protein [Pseudonocardia spinosispora]
MTVQAPFRTSVTVSGMTCQHCVSSVTEELTELDGVRSVDVTLSDGSVIIMSDRELSGDEIRAAIDEAGYTVTD